MPRGGGLRVSALNPLQRPTITRALHRVKTALRLISTLEPGGPPTLHTALRMQPMDHAHAIASRRAPATLPLFGCHTRSISHEIQTSDRCRSGRMPCRSLRIAPTRAVERAFAVQRRARAVVTRRIMRRLRPSMIQSVPPIAMKTRNAANATDTGLFPVTSRFQIPVQKIFGDERGSGPLQRWRSQSAHVPAVEAAGALAARCRRVRIPGIASTCLLKAGHRERFTTVSEMSVRLSGRSPRNTSSWTPF